MGDRESVHTAQENGGKRGNENAGRVAIEAIPSQPDCARSLALQVLLLYSKNFGGMVGLPIGKASDWSEPTCTRTKPAESSHRQLHLRTVSWRLSQGTATTHPSMDVCKLGHTGRLVLRPTGLLIISLSPVPFRRLLLTSGIFSLNIPKLV